MPGPGGPTVGRVNIRVAPDTSRFRRELGQSLEALERTLTVNIPTRIDTKRVARDAARVKADVENQLGTIRTSVQVNADTAAARADLRNTARDRTATVRANVDRSSIQQAQALLDGLGSSLGRMTGGAAGLGAITGSLSLLAAGAASAVVPVVQLGTALAPAVGLLAALPAAGATAVAAIAPLAVALSGVGEALEAALTGNTEDLTAALEGLAPAAQDVVRAVAQMRPALSDLREQVQEAFFAPLVEPVSELGERLLPTLAEGMAEVSASLGEGAASMVEFATTARTVDGLDTLFASTSRSVAGVSSGLPGLLSGLRDIGLEGLPFVEQLSRAVGEAGEAFGRWARASAESGRATAWIADAIGVFEQLGSIAGNVGSIIASIGRAAGDGGLLTTLESLTAELDTFFGSAEGGEALEGVFEGLSSVGTALGPVLTALASAIGTLSPPIGRLAQAFGPVLTTAIEGLTPALAALEPGLMAIINGLGLGVDALVSSGALEEMGAALSTILVALSPLMPLLGQLAATLGGMLADAVITLAPALEILARELAENLAPVLPQLSESFGELMAALAPLIPPLTEALVPILGLLPVMITNISTQMTAWAGVLRDLEPEITVIIAAIGLLIEWAVRLAAWWIGMATTFTVWSAEMSQKARDALREIGDEIGDFHRSAIGSLLAFFNRAAGLVDGIRRYFEVGFQAMLTFVLTAFSLMVSGGRERLQNLVKTASRIPYAIQVAVGHLGSLLRQAGRNVIIGLQNGIVSKMPDLYGTMNNVASSIRAYFPFSPAKVGPLRTNPPDVAGENITRMLAEGLERGRSIVANATLHLAQVAVVDPDLSGARLGGERLAASAEAQAARMEQVLTALRELRSQQMEVILEVDSQEIARASDRGHRQMARR